MIPVLPKLIVSFEGGNFGQGSRVVGYFAIAWAFMQFMCQPILGALSDRFGRRPVVLVSNLAMGVDYIIMALAPSLAWLFIGRLISGAAAASTSTASAYIADITPPEKRAARFGMLGAAFGLGFVLGPAIGGLLGQIDLRLPFWGAAGFCLLNATYGFFVLPESLAPENRTESFVWKTAHVLGSMKFLSRERVWACSRWRSSCPIWPMESLRACSCSIPTTAIIGTPRPPAWFWRWSASPRPWSRRDWCGRRSNASARFRPL